MIEKERPDGIMLAFGGQTALNLGVQVSTHLQFIDAKTQDDSRFGRPLSTCCLAIHGPSLISHADYETYIQMNRMGIFERYGVKVLGTSIKTLETSEDRDLLYVISTLLRSYEERRLEPFCGCNC